MTVRFREQGEPQRANSNDELNEHRLARHDSQTRHPAPRMRVPRFPSIPSHARFDSGFNSIIVIAFVGIMRSILFVVKRGIAIRLLTVLNYISLIGMNADTLH